MEQQLPGGLNPGEQGGTGLSLSQASEGDDAAQHVELSNVVEAAAAAGDAPQAATSPVASGRAHVSGHGAEDTKPNQQGVAPDDVVFGGSSVSARSAEDQRGTTAGRPLLGRARKRQRIDSPEDKSQEHISGVQRLSGEDSSSSGAEMEVDGPVEGATGGCSQSACPDGGGQQPGDDDTPADGLPALLQLRRVGLVSKEMALCLDSGVQGAGSQN